MEESIPNSNPFLTLPVVDAVQLSTASSDAGSLSSRTPSHEVFDHYNPFFDSNSSLASDLDTAAQIETFITGTGDCLAARLLTWEMSCFVTCELS